MVARGSDGVVYDTGQTAQGSTAWRDWRAVNSLDDAAATDPTAFAFNPGGADTWAFVFRRADGTVRFYQAGP